MKIYTTYLKKLPTRSIPDWKIWSIGKNCGWESFKEAYTRDILGKLDPHKVIKDLEKPVDNCHSEVKEYEKNRT